MVEPVRVAMRMLGREIADSGVKMEIILDPSLRARAVKNQMTQVFVNLIHNAIQALVSSSVPKGQGLIRIIGHDNGKFLKVAVIDNGPGIPEEILSQLFDPFFTTKKAGDGTGLGLSICYRILESHRGEITVKSQPEVFTKFTLKLPSSNPPTATESHYEQSTRYEHAVS